MIGTNGKTWIQSVTVWSAFRQLQIFLQYLIRSANWRGRALPCTEKKSKDLVAGLITRSWSVEVENSPLVICPEDWLLLGSSSESLSEDESELEEESLDESDKEPTGRDEA